MTKKKVDKVEDAEVESKVLEDVAAEETVEEEVVIDEENQMLSPDDEFGEEDEFEAEGLLTGEQYDVPEDADGFVDADTGEVLKREDMTPWQIIKAIAKQNNVDVRDPDGSCNHCYGRGHEGVDKDTKMPVPCRCIFRGRTEKDKQVEEYWDATRMNKKISREQKRRMAKFLKSAFRRDRREYNRRVAARLPVRDSNDEVEIPETPTREINKVLKEYIKQDSLKKTAKSLNYTLTKVKKIVKENSEKLEKLRTKETK